MKVDSYIEEVEKCIQAFKVQLQEQQKELQEDEGKVLDLLSAFYKKDSPKQDLHCADQMTISFPNTSSISSLFKDDSAESFIFKLGQEDKRRHLVAERRAEYNLYLEKDKELQSRRKVLEESRNVTPRSILESVDYKKILAKRKEEESKFRNLNYAEPSIDKKISKPEISVKENVDLSLENHIKSGADLPIPQPAPIVAHRTGGGGEPVKDSSGNLITNRGYKASSSEYFPFLQDTSKHKKDYYREELRKQIEERKRIKELEEEKARLLEDQIAQRIEQQRRQMQMEYEKELQKNILLKEQRQQERLKQLEEFQKRDAALKNKRMREIQALDGKDSINLNVVQEPPKRSASPPVPSVRSKVILERVVSPEVATKTQALSGVKPENIFSSLAEIRRTIMQEQNNARKDLKDSYEVMNRRTVVDDSDDLPF
ncbi:non-muscle caldesmon-like isoform X2 [Argiope bruennichi]|nr:non-muscle caldesmon-like isoform X2 [Argiope bruennichi]